MVAEAMPFRAHDAHKGTFGTALIVAALAAEGETEISGIEHVDRGYERMAEKLGGLGAVVKRV
jgi:UDP-N-acetylglucosamine 1-carboxyvinyltransferase